VAAVFAQANIDRATIISLKKHAAALEETHGGGLLENDKFIRVLAALCEHGLLSTDVPILGEKELSELADHPIGLEVRWHDVINSFKDEFQNNCFIAELSSYARKYTRMIEFRSH